MSLNIKNKRSAVQGSSPTAAQLQDGELGVNYNASDPAIYLKDSGGAVIRIAGAGSVGSGAVESVNGQTGAVVLSASDVGAATAAQGTKADSALQPGDNISELTNNENYITAADIPAAPVTSVNSRTGVVVLTSADVGAATTAQGAKADSALQSGDDVSELNNDAGYITVAGVPAAPVTSVNSRTGVVVLDAGDVGAATATQGATADSALQPGGDVSELNNDAGYLITAPVESVNGKTGVVSLGMDDLDDVSVASASSGEVLAYNGSVWVSSTAPPADISGSSINQLNDVDASSATSGQVMVWNGTNNWVPGDAVASDPTGVTGADSISNMMSLTQAEYDAIGTPDASTLYIITP